MKKINKKGFTLIELLAVIIILGVLMIIAIPAVTSYIQNSRKSAYIDTGEMYIKAVVNKVNDGQKLQFFTEDVLYMVPVGHASGTTCVSVESGGQSPFNSSWNWAYVGVTYIGSENRFHYYYVAEDASGQGIEFRNQKDLNDNGTDEMYSTTKQKTDGYDILKAQYALHENKVYEDNGSDYYGADAKNASDYTKLKTILTDHCNDADIKDDPTYHAIVIVGAPSNNINCKFSNKEF
jgi:prepilin-type N-terminal cleavage/methylation domain-containing protein